jgi:hypothetical protein
VSGTSGQPKTSTNFDMGTVCTRIKKCHAEQELCTTSFLVLTGFSVHSLQYNCEVLYFFYKLPSTVVG